jgi:PAP2 superfamily
VSPSADVVQVAGTDDSPVIDVRTRVGARQPALTPMARQLFREAALVNAAILAYFGIRNLTAGSVDTAFGNARRLIRLEEALGLGWERGVQAAIDGTPVVTVANWVYIWGHWPVIVVTGVTLFVLRRDRYRLLRNAMFVSGAIGFVFFALFPVAPPRLLDLGLIDTVTQQSHAYRALQPPGLTNQYAAFPSLHAGWNVLVGIVLFGTTTRIAVRAFALLSPLAMVLAVVATANHFVVDVAGGIAVVLIGLGAAVAVDRSRSAAPLSTRAAVFPLARPRGTASRERRARSRGRRVPGAGARRARPAGRRVPQRSGHRQPKRGRLESRGRRRLRLGRRPHTRSAFHRWNGQGGVVRWPKSDGSTDR